MSEARTIDQWQRDVWHDIEYVCLTDSECTDTCGPYWMRFVLLQIHCTADNDNNHIFYRSHEFCDDPETDDVTQVEEVATGTVKWDGCLDMKWRDDTYHFCGATDLKLLADALSRAHALCLQRMGRIDGGDLASSERTDP